MKRSALKRKAPMKQRQPRRMSDEEREGAIAFWASVQDQPCAGCGKASGSPFSSMLWTYHHAHHVVYQQHIPCELLWDERNALGVCNDCHERHHNASRRIPIAALTEQNWEFAREVLGQAADDYLARYYAPSVPEGEE